MHGCTAVGRALRSASVCLLALASQLFSQALCTHTCLYHPHYRHSARLPTPMGGCVLCTADHHVLLQSAVGTHCLLGSMPQQVCMHAVLLHMFSACLEHAPVHRHAHTCLSTSTQYTHACPILCITPPFGPVCCIYTPYTHVYTYPNMLYPPCHHVQVDWT